MKKTLIVLVGVVIMVGGAYVAFAQTQGMPGRPSRGRMRAKSAGYGSMCPCPMHRGMMGSMMDKEMEVTDNGEVIVMIGCQLFKYDANLQEVAKTQIEIDMEAMQKKMQQMMENCPMRQEMMQMQDDNSTDGNGNQN